MCTGSQTHTIILKIEASCKLQYYITCDKRLYVLMFSLCSRSKWLAAHLYGALSKPSHPLGFGWVWIDRLQYTCTGCVHAGIAIHSDTPLCLHHVYLNRSFFVMQILSNFMFSCKNVVSIFFDGRFSGESPKLPDPYITKVFFSFYTCLSHTMFSKLFAVFFVFVVSALVWKHLYMHLFRIIRGPHRFTKSYQLQIGTSLTISDSFCEAAILVSIPHMFAFSQNWMSLFGEVWQSPSIELHANDHVTHVTKFVSP